MGIKTSITKRFDWLTQVTFDKKQVFINITALKIISTLDIPDIL